MMQQWSVSHSIFFLKVVIILTHKSFKIFLGVFPWDLKLEKDIFPITYSLNFTVSTFKKNTNASSCILIKSMYWVLKKISAIIV